MLRQGTWLGLPWAMQHAWTLELQHVLRYLVFLVITERCWMYTVCVITQSSTSLKKAEQPAKDQTPKGGDTTVAAHRGTRQIAVVQWTHARLSGTGSGELETVQAAGLRTCL